MPRVTYVVTNKVKPGRAADAIARAQAVKQELLNQGAQEVRLLQTVAGPAAPAMIFAATFESMASFEEIGPKFQASAVWQAALADTDPPVEAIAQGLSVEIE